ncbi:glycosyltransferase family protein [Winogradskyella aurantiaca]|uniref:hypothetical protein n=1 Tax=Winogradskyella aurantiaca TaxID=2219558 RepID=UPI0013008E7E|nr:hypothetical protein [Winogradskyella aurantiaca]
MGRKRDPKNIIMVAYAFPPINYSGTERPFQFVKHISSYGYYPQVISQVDYINYYVEKSDAYKLKELHPKTRVYRLQSIKTKLEEFKLISYFDRLLNQVTGKVKILSRLLYLPFQLTLGEKEWEVRAVLRILRLNLSKDFQLIWATGPAWQDLTVGYWSSRLLKLPYVMDLRDPLTYGVLWRTDDEKEKITLKQRETKYLKHASLVVFTSPLTEKEYVRRYPFISGKTTTITNGFEVSNAVRRKDKVQKDKFVISYIGRLTAGIRDPEFFLEGFKLACTNKEFSEAVELRIIGYVDEFRELIESYNSQNNIKITGVVSRKESFDLMTNSDALILIQSISGEGSDVISGKIYDYLNANKWMIAIVDEDGGDSWLINRLKCGEVSGLKNIEKVRDVLINAYLKWREGKIELDYSNKFAEFDRKQLTKTLAHQFDKVLTNDSLQ